MKVEDTRALSFILDDELYLLNEDKNSITASPKPQPVVETPPPDFNYLGSNKKNFLILVNYAGHDFIPDDHLAALESVLGRKGYSREDVAILNLAKHTGAMYEQLSAHFNPQTLLILGKETMPAGLAELPFNAVGNRDVLKLLHTFSFDDMMRNVDNKKAFWEQVKNL